MHLSTTLAPANRIEIADVLRGFAVMGITLIHFIERFSLYSFPEETNHWLIFTDRVIWDSIFLLFRGKLIVFLCCFSDLAFLFRIIHKRKKGKISAAGLPGGWYCFSL